MTVERSWMRADLHVHSYHSGYASHLRFLHTRDCYSDPVKVYRTAKARGMDLVTLTDHDSIDGCLEFLSRQPEADDFFISEEIECWLPDVGVKIHVGAYDITEEIHAEVQRLRANVHEVTAFLVQRNICCALHHPLFFFNRQTPLDDYLQTLWPLFPAIEVQNGAMLPEQNAFVAALLRDLACAGGPVKTSVGGSDAHTLRAIATTYTEAEGRTRREFLDSLRSGRTRVAGRHGSALRVAREIYGVIWQYWRTLLGGGRRELSWARRALGVTWSIATLPVEFLPLAIGVVEKSGEARRMARYRREWLASNANRIDAPANEGAAAVEPQGLAASVERP